MDVPVIALPHDADVDVSSGELRVLVADDLGEESGELLAIDFVRTAGRGGRGQIVDTHVKSLAREMFSASLADVFVTALGRPTSETSAPLSLIARIRPRLKRLLNERAQRVFARKGHDGISFHSMVLRGSIAGALRSGIEHVNANVVVFGRRRTLHRHGDAIGHVSAKTMFSFQKPVLIVPL